MATATKIPLASVTLSADTASVTFGSISQSYTDLILIISCDSSGNQYSHFRLNTDTGSNYSVVDLVGNGVAPYSDKVANTTLTYSGRVESSKQTTQILNIMSYSNTTTYKTVLSRSSNTGTGEPSRMAVSLWRNTSAVTSIEVYNGGSVNWKSGSTFNLYGIL